MAATPRPTGGAPVAFPPVPRSAGLGDRLGSRGERVEPALEARIELPEVMQPAALPDRLLQGWLAGRSARPIRAATSPTLPRCWANATDVAVKLSSSNASARSATSSCRLGARIDQAGNVTDRVPNVSGQRLRQTFPFVRTNRWRWVPPLSSSSRN